MKTEEKYIVKNCGCNPSCDECYINCKDISDCLLKRVIKEIEWELRAIPDSDLAERILSMFEIERVEE